jgi:hypothetical protein
MRSGLHAQCITAPQKGESYGPSSLHTLSVRIASTDDDAHAPGPGRS